MIKKIIAGLCLVMSTVAFSQENNASPYSFYGIGDLKFKGTTENRSMGGLGILPDSIHINLQNPASYSSLKLTTFTLAGTTSSTNLKSDSQSATATRTTFDYLAVALPFNKIGVSFGLMPYTSVGYRVQNKILPAASPDGFGRKSQFTGDGGVNRVFGGAAYKITKNFSLGADFQYFFGDIETQSIVSITDPNVDDASLIQYGTREINKSSYNGAGVNIGATYQGIINKKYTWYASATYSPETTLRSTTDRTISTISFSSTGSGINDELEKITAKTDVKIPSKVAVGTGFGQDRLWFAGVEYTYQESNKIGNRFDNITNSAFENSHKFSLGGYYIPQYLSYTSYLSRVTYRAGLKYEKTGLLLNGEHINDMGLSAGVGLPLSGIVGGSNLNIGAEFGRRGTTSAGLIRETYVNLFVSLSLNDKWFVKRKFD